VEKKTIYDIIQAKILLKLEEAIQSGEKFTWVKPWKGAPYPCSYSYPEKPFSSPVNLLFLDAGEYLTYQQIIKFPNAKIKKGAKQDIVFQIFPVFQKDEHGEKILDDEGNPVIERFQMKYSREYHISNVEGIRSHFVPVDYEHTRTESMEMADLVIAAYSEAHHIEISELYGTGQAYNQGRRVVLPERRQYPNIYEYYSTVFHELGHSTGKELKRQDLSYAQEELVAEITASLLCSSLGLENEEAEQNNLAYLKHWYEQIKEASPKGIYFAVVAAKEAAELIMDTCPVVKQRLEPQILKLDEQDLSISSDGEVVKEDAGRRDKTL